MSKKISFDVSMEDLQKAKKMYDQVVKHEPELTFDQFLEKIAKNAFDAQLQISEMNESMNKMMSGFMENMGKTTGIDETFKNIDSMVQDIFKGKMNPTEDNVKKEDPSKKTKN